MVWILKWINRNWNFSRIVLLRILRSSYCKQRMHCITTLNSWCDERLTCIPFDPFLLVVFTVPHSFGYIFSNKVVRMYLRGIFHCYKCYAYCSSPTVVCNLQKDARTIIYMDCWSDGRGFNPRQQNIFNSPIVVAHLWKNIISPCQLMPNEIKYMYICINVYMHI